MKTFLRIATTMVSRSKQAIFIAIKLIIGISVVHSEVCPADEKKNWTYRGDHCNGPEHWGEETPGCNGKLQSPINIITSKVLKLDPPQYLMLKNFDKPVEEVLIKNSGQFFTITPKDGVNRSLFLNGYEFPFYGFHFHFGNIAEGGGSEHTIDGKRFPMEAHFLFLFPDNSFIQISSLFEFNDVTNPAVNNILYVKPSYKYEGGKYEGKINRTHSNPRQQGKIYLDDILDLHCPYYSYTGSNSIPPCEEGTPWLICKTTKCINPSQWRKLLKFVTVSEDEDVQNDCLMKNNNRPLQDNNNRPIYG